MMKKDRRSGEQVQGNLQAAYGIRIMGSIED
jgi:hypothetical protein